MKVSVSFIKSKYNELKTIELINSTTADYIHVDIMDGIFVENKNYTPENIISFFKNINKPLDIHLMVKDPILYIEKLSILKPEYIIFHIEAVDNPMMIIDLIHSYNIKCGISLKPHTEINELKPYLDKIEQVLIMSVEPGLGGQAFIPSSVSKIRELKSIGGPYLISIDGGINDDTINLVKDADMVVSGSYICMSDNYQEKINILKA